MICSNRARGETFDPLSNLNLGTFTDNAATSKHTKEFYHMCLTNMFYVTDYAR